MTVAVEGRRDAGTSPAARIRTGRWLMEEWMRRELRVRFRSPAGALIRVYAQPVALLVVYGVVLFSFLRVRTPDTPYLLFAASGVALWGFFIDAITRSVTSLVSVQPVLGRAYFPREVVPLAVVAATSVELLLLAAPLLPAQLLVGTGAHLSMLFAPLAMLGLALLAAGAAVWLATLSVFLRNLSIAVGIALQLVFIASPVMYPASRIPGRFSWVITVNPVAHSLAAFRDAFLFGRSPHLVDLLVPPAVGVILLIGGVRYVAAVEHRLAELA